MNGIQSYVRILLDKLSADKTVREGQQVLNKATDPSQARRNISVIDGAMAGLKRAAIGLGAAFAGAFAAVGITRFARDAIGTFAEAEAVWNRLAGTLRTAGVEFGAVKGEIEKAARAMQDATTVGDEDFAQVLQTLVRVSGDYQTSLKNVQVVADLAAGAQVDLGTAATLVGKAMIGETDTLKRYGIVVKEGDDAIAAIAKRFHGMAENEARTFQGRLKQINNEWGDFKEAIGAALVESGGDGVNVLTQLRDGLKSAAAWVTANADAFRDLGKAVVDFGGWVARDIAASIKQLHAMLQVVKDIRRALPGSKHDIKGPELDYEDIHGAGAHRSLIIRSPDKPAPTSGTGGETDKERKAREAAERKAAAAAKRARRDAAAEQRQADEEATRRMQAEDRRFNAGPKFENTIETGRLPEISDRRSAMAIVTAYDAQQAKIRETADVWRDAHRDMENATQNVAAGIMDSFGQAVEMMITGAGSIGDAFVGLGAGIASDILGGLKQLATGKVVENVAWAFEKFAHGNIPQGTAFLAAAAKWTAAGGVAAGLGGAMGGIGRGGGGNVHRGGGGVYGRDTANRTEPRPPEVHVYNNFTLDPTNPNTARFIYKAQNTGVELAGRPDWAKK